MNKIFYLAFSIISLTSIGQDAFEKTTQVGALDEILYDGMGWNSGYLVSGYYKSGANYKSFISEVDTSGAVTATHEYGTSNDNGIYDMIKTSTGDIVACGYSFNSPKYDFVVFRIGSDFNQKWENTYVDQQFSWEEQTNMGITELSDGNFAVVGRDLYTITKEYMFVAKIDSANGDTLWTKKINTAGYNYSAKNILATSDGGMVIAGQAIDTLTSFNSIAVVKLDASGATVWNKIITNTNKQLANDIVKIDGKGFMIAGKRYGSTWEALAMKIDENGSEVWSNVYSDGGGGFDDVYSIAKTVDKGFVMAGISNNTNAYILKLDSTGTNVYSEIYTTTNKSLLNSAFTTSDNGVLAVGYNTVSSNANLYMLKLDASGKNCNNFPVPSFSFSDSTTIIDTVSFAANVKGGNGTLDYSWYYLNGSALQTQATFNNQYVTKGLYPVHLEITDANDCVGINYIDLVVKFDSLITEDTAVGSISNLRTNGMDIVVYPNPATDVLHLTSSMNLSNHRISLFNTSGTLVRREKYNSIGLQLNGLASGTYAVLVNDSQNLLVFSGKISVE